MAKIWGKKQRVSLTFCPWLHQWSPWHIRSTLSSTTALGNLSSTSSDSSTQGHLEIAHNTQWHLPRPGNCLISVKTSLGFNRQLLSFKQYCIFFLPQEDMFLDDGLFFHPQRTKQAPWNRLSQGRKPGVFRESLLGQNRVRRWPREHAKWGWRGGSNCKEHTATTTSWASRSGKVCSPAGVILSVFIAPFVHSRSLRKRCHLAPIQGRLHIPGWEEYSLARTSLNGTPQFLQ